MTRLRVLAARLRGLFAKGRLDRELADEIESHLALSVEANVNRGMDPAEARRAALRAFGGVEQTKEAYRDARGLPRIEALVQDLRYGLRTLRRSPGFAATAAVSIALGVGANTAIFSILDKLLLRELQVREPRRLVRVATEDGATAYLTTPAWEELHKRELFDQSLAWAWTQFDLSEGGPAELVGGVWASGGFFDVLGVRAVLGRTFSEEDSKRGGGPDGPVAVISYRFWQRRFGGAGDTVGQTLAVERVPFKIIGVTPPDFAGVDVGFPFDVALPIGVEPLIHPSSSQLDNPYAWWLSVIARLKPTQDMTAAGAALRSAQSQIRDATMPGYLREEDRKRYLGEPLTLQAAATGDSALRRRYERPLAALMAVVVLVLLIACANVANLMLARTAARRHELAMRLALGATRLRVARQLLAESVLLAGAGSALGLLFAYWGARLLVAQFSTQAYSVALDLPLDWRVLGFTAAVGTSAVLLFGVVPALRAARTDPGDALKVGVRGVSSGHRHGPGSALVVAQVAVSLVLVVVAGLFIRTFSALAGIDVGFERDRVLAVRVDAQRTANTPPTRLALYQRVREAVGALPGVLSAASSASLPISNMALMAWIDVPGGPALSEPDRAVSLNLVSPEWFRTLGTPLRAGRDFDGRDLRAVHSREGDQVATVIHDGNVHGHGHSGRMSFRRGSSSPIRKVG